MIDVIEKMNLTKIIPVLSIDRIEDAVPLANALKNAGISVIEITYRTEIAFEAIKKINEEVDGLLILAGTILTPDMADNAIKAGASGIVSPGFNEKTVDWCIERNITIIPGVATPSEIEMAMRKNLKLVKLFPAEILGGTKYIKSLSGPYNKVKFMPTGGINSQNILDYLELKNVICCGGSWLVQDEKLIVKEYEEIEKNASEEVNKIKNSLR